MKKYFTAKYDLIFQQALCLEKDKDLLTWFLEKIFNQKIINLEIKTPVLPIRSKIEKRKTVDLLIIFEDKIVNLEVNSSHYKYLNERNFSYITAVYNSIFEKGKRIKSKDEVIQINFTWGLPKKYEKIDVLTYDVRDKKHNDLYIDNFKIIVYNMDYIKEVYYNKTTKKYKQDAPKHLLMLDSNKEELEKLCKGDKIMEKFKENVEKLNKDEIIIDFLTKEEEDELKKQSYLDEGYELGEEKGMKAGQKIGKELGKKEEKENLAVKMIQKNMKLEDISEITGLSIDYLKKLK